MEMAVYLRYDDYSNDSNLFNENALFNMAAEHGVQILVGIVPYTMSRDGSGAMVPLSHEKAAVLSAFIERGVVVPALHGLTHVNRSTTARPGEYVGNDIIKLRRMIEKGQCMLEERLARKINAIIPPWNSYSGEALVVFGERFELLSPGIHQRPIRGKCRCAVLPSTVEISEVTIADIRDARGAMENVVILMHPSDLEKMEGNVEMTSKISEILDIVADSGEHSKSWQSVNDEHSYGRYLAYLYYRKLIGILPQVLRVNNSSVVYYSGSRLLQRLLIAALCCVILYFSVGSVASVLSVVTVKALGSYAGIAYMLAVIIFGYMLRSMYYRTWVHYVVAAYVAVCTISTLLMLMYSIC